MSRVSIAAALLACAARDLADIEALPKGAVWTRILFNACDVMGSPDGRGSWRIYVHRRLGACGGFHYALQEEEDPETWDPVATTRHERGEADDAEEIVAQFPYWAELARREVAEIQKSLRERAREARGRADGFPLPEVGLCNECAYGLGARFVGCDDRSVPGACPLCGRLGWIFDAAAWEGLPESTVAKARVPRPASEDASDRSRILALAPMESLTRLLLDARGYTGRDVETCSYRLDAYRMASGGLALSLQEYDAETDGEWATVVVPGEGGGPRRIECDDAGLPAALETVRAWLEIERAGLERTREEVRSGESRKVAA